MPPVPYSDFGNSFIGNAFISDNGQITTIPEAQTLFVATLLVLGGIAHFITQRQRKSENAAKDRVFVVR